MEKNLINLKREHQASISRQPYKYSLAARFFFSSMDFVAGRKNTLSKIKLLEILASIPYREWEIFNYRRMTRYYQNLALNERARQIVSWSREAQDNEYMHLLVVTEKMKADKISDAMSVEPTSLRSGVLREGSNARRAAPPPARHTLAPHCVPWHRPPHRPGALSGGQVWCSADVDDRTASPWDMSRRCHNKK